MIHGHLLAALGHTALLFACLRMLGGKGPIPFALVPLTGALVLTAAWGWQGVALHRDPPLDPFALGLHLLLDLLRYGCWFAFLWALVLQRPAPRAVSAPEKALVAGTALLLGLALVPAVHLLAGLRLPAPQLRWVPLAWMFLPIAGLVLVEQVHRNAAQGVRWALQPLVLALAGVFAFDLYLTSRAVLLSQVDGASIGMRGLVHGLAAPLIWVTLRRQAGGWPRFALSRGAAFHTAALLLVGGYLLLVALAGYTVRDFDAAWGPALQLSFLFAALLAGAVVALSGTARSALRVAVSKTFFRYRYDYRAEWLRFTALLSERGGRQDIGETVVRGLAEMVESPAGVLWTPHPDGERFVPAAHWNLPRRPASEARGSAFVRFLTERGWIIDLDELRRAPQHYGGLQLPPWLAAGPRAWLVIPLLAGEDLAGFVVLAPPRVPQRADWEVRDLLKTAGRQAATFLAHVAATEALMESRRFEAFNRMSAFVVHDLKNVVTQLSLMMKNARRLHADPEFQQDMLATVESSLDKMRGLIRQLREGEPPAGADAGGVDLAPMARRLAGMCSVQGRSLELRSISPLRVRGDEERLFRALGHLVQNALDASTPADRVWLSVGLSAQHALVVVGDTGQGMTPEFVESRLFRPFHTTKAHGMGIGFYESARYVQELGGRLSIDSEPGKGTRVTLHLPLHPAPVAPKPQEEIPR